MHTDVAYQKQIKATTLANKLSTEKYPRERLLWASLEDVALDEVGLTSSNTLSGT
jgi:hypothetical protein